MPSPCGSCRGGVENVVLLEDDVSPRGCFQTVAVDVVGFILCCAGDCGGCDVDAEDGEVGVGWAEEGVEEEGDAAAAGAEVEDAERALRVRSLQLRSTCDEVCEVGGQIFRLWSLIQCQLL